MALQGHELQGLCGCTGPWLQTWHAVPAVVTSVVVASGVRVRRLGVLVSFDFSCSLTAAQESHRVPCFRICLMDSSGFLCGSLGSPWLCPYTTCAVKESVQTDVILPLTLEGR